MNFSANCMIRGSAAAWICPKLELFSPVIGPLKFTLLNTLNTSHRNCTDSADGSLNVRVRAKSFCRVDGLRIVKGGRSLYVPGVGVVNAARLRYCVGAPEPYGSSRIWTARWPPMPVSALSTPVVTLDRLPLCHRTIGENCQSLRIAPATPWPTWPTPATTEMLTTCRRSDEQYE